MNDTRERDPFFRRFFDAHRAEDIAQRRRRLEAAEAAREAFAMHGTAERCLHCALALDEALQSAEALAMALDWLRRRPGAPQPSGQPADDATATIALYDWAIRRLARSGDAASACTLAVSASQRFPDDLGLEVAQWLTLPGLYDTEEAIAEWRSRFIAGLDRASARLLAAPPEQACDVLAHRTNFALAYQALDDTALQSRYGDLLAAVVGAAARDWTPGVVATPVARDGRIVVGFVSDKFHGHVVSDLFDGWIRGLDRSRFMLVLYHSGDTVDVRTAEFRALVERVRTVPEVESAVRAIRADAPDVLIHLDVGMSGISLALASLRLAPVQCAAWGHPVTTGCNAIDHFLSSALMEPGDGDAHYREHLVRLPGLGIAPREPSVSRALMSSSRAAFELPEHGPLYLCSQFSGKLLPRQDRYFAEILQAVPQATLVFVGRDPLVTSRLRDRLARACTPLGVDASTRIVVTPPLSHFDFLRLHLLCDLALDSFEWSGGHTALQAIACGLPIVTLPGRFMRSRHTAAMLEALDLTETVATSPADWVRIAVQLGRDDAARRRLAARWREPARRARIFGRPEAGVDLGAFLQRAVGRA
jgi:protein O-GlcNAc transferase